MQAELYRNGDDFLSLIFCKKYYNLYIVNNDQID